MRIGRWFLYRAHRELRVERGADPNCPDCIGVGAWWDDPQTDPMNGLEIVACPCNDGPRIRIPLGRRTRTAYSTEPPF